MPAISLAFVIIQALISVFVYAGAEQYGSRSPLVAGLAMFVLGIALIFALNTVVQLVVVETLIALAYFVGLRSSRQSSIST